jgi:hypothetical protein
MFRGSGHLSNAAASWQPPAATPIANASASPPAVAPIRGLRSRLLAHLQSQLSQQPRPAERRRYGEAVRLENNFRLGRYTVRPPCVLMSCVAALLKVANEGMRMFGGVGGENR